MFLLESLGGFLNDSFIFSPFGFKIGIVIYKNNFLKIYN